MAKQLVKIINTYTKKEFTGSDLINPHLISHAETSPDSYELVYGEVDEIEKGKPTITLAKLMAKSVKELHSIASDNNINFGVPASHMTKAEIANAIIEGMKGKK